MAGSTASFGASSNDMYVTKTSADRVDIWRPGYPRMTEKQVLGVLRRCRNAIKAPSE